MRSTSLAIYNTLTREKQRFVPIEPGKVRMYVCGMTVYDYCHLGHGRVLVVFDMVQRWLRHCGYVVTYVRNITDIDDKIIQRAIEKGKTVSQLTEHFIDAMNNDAATLGVMPPDHAPRARDYIVQMQEIIETLQDKGYAYQVQAAQDVYYAVRKFTGYGKLSRKTLDDLRAGERIGINQHRHKHDPLDFVLWKATKKEDPSEVQWSSPWGKGRPGWHIECSAMSKALLGQHFDIHGGGQDLQFPHHDNEIAQSEGAYGAPFVNVWMHNGFVRVENEKMSKSLGNFFTIRDILARYDAEVVRFFILRAHYRSPLNYANAHLEDAKQALTRLYTAVNKGETMPNSHVYENDTDVSDAYRQRFTDAMNDDFNTPIAIAVLFDLANDIHKNRGHAKKLVQELKVLGGVLGLLQRSAIDFLKEGALLSEEDIQQQINERSMAKQAKDFVTADKIRSALFAQGIVLEDRPSNITEWRKI